MFSLGEVVTVANNDRQGARLALSAQEKKDLVAFLRMLTDSSFISDKRFSNPFKYENNTGASR